MISLNIRRYRNKGKTYGKETQSEKSFLVAKSCTYRNLLRGSIFKEEAVSSIVPTMPIKFKSVTYFVSKSDYKSIVTNA